jgi:hypothetical protein
VLGEAGIPADEVYLFGRSARVGALRSRPHAISAGPPALVTIHPLAVLRAGDTRAERRAELLQDLTLAANLFAEGRAGTQIVKTTKS